MLEERFYHLWTKAGRVTLSLFAVFMFCVGMTFIQSLRNCTKNNYILLNLQ